MVEKLDVDEHCGCVGELVGDDAEEGFGAEKVALGACAATLGLECCETYLEDREAVAV